MSARTLVLAFVLLAGCATATSNVVTRCTIEITSVTPDAGSPGDQVVVQAAPLTSAWDSAVYLGAARATVVDLARDDCDACDSCLDTNGCNICSICAACVTECTQDCVQTLTFEVPQVSSGTLPMVIYNSHGQSRPTDFTVIGAPDTASGDTAADSGAGR